jgi:hypothetical protein
MGVWVIVSFAGVMFNAGNAELWTTSLMWALLASLVVMPCLVIAHHMQKNAQRRNRSSHTSDSEEAVSEQPAFVSDRERNQTPWPSSETTAE